MMSQSIWPGFSTGTGRRPAGRAGAARYNRGMGLLWFGRSRRGETKRDARPAEPAAPRRSIPLRLRGVLLLNLKPADGLGQIEQAPPLGARSAVLDAVRAVVPGFAVDAAGRGELVGSDYRVALDLGPSDPVHTAVAEADGDTGVELLRSLLVAQRWRAYAPRAGVFIEPDALDLFALPDAAPPQNKR